MPTKLQISGVIISFNEEKHIEKCVRSLQTVTDEIIVVDSFSTDGTKVICSRLGVRFIEHVFEGYVAQKNYALAQASFDMVLSLDADEYLSEELQSSIRDVRNHTENSDCYIFNRLNNYCGKTLRHGEAYPDRRIRLWDRRKGMWGGTDPHDHVVMKEGSVRRLQGDIMHFPYTYVDEHFEKILRFSEIAAKAKYKQGAKSNMVKILFSPLIRFFKGYLFQLGFLDGYYGFVFCTVGSMGTWLKYMRLREYNKRGLPKS